MATRYVSNSTLNSYSVGNDSNSAAQATSKSTPWLTLTHAVATASNGDTIVINDGTYLETNFISVSVANLTINAQTDNLAIIQNNSAGSRVLHCAAAGTGLILGKIVLDAQNTQTGCLTADSGFDVANITILGTWFINSVSNCIYSLLHVKNFVMDGSWLVTPNIAIPISINTSLSIGQVISIKNGTINAGSNCQIACYTTPVSGGNIQSITFDNVTINGSNMNNGGSAYGIRIQPSGTGTLTSATVKNCNITVSSLNASAAVIPILVTGCTTEIINNNTCIVPTSLPAQGCTAIDCQSNTAGSTTTTCSIFNNNLLAPIPVAPGHGIQVGDDTSTAPVAGANSISGITVYGNTVNGFNHGVLIAWVSGGLIYGNNVSNCFIGVIDKYGGQNSALPNVFTGNIISKLSSSVGGGLRTKAAIGTIHANNLVIMDGVTGTSNYGMWASSDGANNSTGIIYDNNIIYQSTGVLGQAIVVDASSTATFSHNNYYSVGGFGAIPFSYQGTTYGSVAAWLAANESSALNVDPQFVSFSQGNYRVLATNSSLYHTGIFASINALDYQGRPFNIPPTIGAYEIFSRTILTNRTPDSTRILAT